MQLGHVTLETDRLKLRAVSESDTRGLFEMWSDPETMRYWSSPPMTELAHAEARVHKIVGDISQGLVGQWALELKETGRVAGTCTLFKFHEPSRRAELGYALMRQHWKKGLMTEALGALITHAFEELGLNRLEADIDPRNLASARLLERLGFVQEGLLRQRWIVAGEVSDTGFYGLLREDWEDLRKR